MASSYPPEKKVEYWTKVVVLVSAICASGYGAWLKLGDVVTLPELVAHDESKKAHEPLREIIRAQAGQDSDLDRKLIDLRHELESLGERAVSLEAADREPDRRKKSSYAAFCVVEYRSLVRRGYTVREAMEEVRRLPWPPRAP